jgi:tetratricopeptide (TPR) repeat protein
MTNTTRHVLFHNQLKGQPRMILLRPFRATRALAGIAFVVFLPALNHDFVNWDDGPYIYENPLVLGGLSAAGFRRACTVVVFSNWAAGVLEQAIDAYAHAVQIDPEHIQACNNLANLQARLRRFEEAIPLDRSIIDRDPKANVARRNLATALQDQVRGVASKRSFSP